MYNLGFRSFVLAVAAFAGLTFGAQASVIDFNMSTDAANAFVGPAYSQDGYTFTSHEGGTDSLFNWIGDGLPQYNAQGPTNPTLAVNYGGDYVTITHDDGTPFSFTQIGVTSVYAGNAGDFTSGKFDLTFHYVSGPDITLAVNLADDATGLQMFYGFVETNLTSVDLQADSMYGNFFQFDRVGLSGTSIAPTDAPEPMTLSLFGAGLLAVRKRKK